MVHVLRTMVKGGRPRACFPMVGREEWKRDPNYINTSWGVSRSIQGMVSFRKKGATTFLKRVISCLGLRDLENPFSKYKDDGFDAKVLRG